MTEATDSSLNILAALFILVPVVIIAVVVIVIKEAGKRNDRKQ